MEKNIVLNGISYQFKELFDVNLTLAYENDTWDEWHIIREFVSNALDSVSGDPMKIDINIQDKVVHIHDQGEGYPLVFAKRIGASSKKRDSDSIGQFGEGIKLSLLTCIRKNIPVSLASQNWLILPRAIELDEQQILMYEIYESSEFIIGTLVTLGVNEKIIDIIQNIDQYFLHFRKSEHLFGNLKEGIYALTQGKAKLYNKGVYIRDIEALYSYAISIEKLNRDRDFISHSDAAYRIRDIWEKVDLIELVKTMIQTSTSSYSQRQKYIEFYSGIYSNYPEVWANAFIELYGKNSVLYTNDIACREAQSLGLSVVKTDYILTDLLKRGGVKEDKDGLSDDYEFTFVESLNANERDVLSKLYSYANLLNIELPNDIRIFENYENHEDIPGLYNPESKQIYLRRDLLNSDIGEAVSVFIHESNHHKTKFDDLSREFAQSLCDMLTNLLFLYEKDSGINTEFDIHPKGILLPNDIPITTNGLTASVILTKSELNIILGQHTIKIKLQSITVKAALWTRKVLIHKNRFLITLPDTVLQFLPISTTVKGKVKRLEAQ